MSDSGSMTDVVVSYDETRLDHSEISRFAVGNTTTFQSFPICAFQASTDRVPALHSVTGVTFVHSPRFVSSYVKILQRLDELCQLPEEKRVRVLVVNLSVSHGPSRFQENEPINLATRIAAQRGFVSVIAVGNEGPEEDTLSPWSVAPWVIGVGAADAAGEELWSGSSIGIPGDPVHRPTVVAPGKDVPVLSAPWPHRERRHGVEVASVALGVGDVNTPERVLSGTSLATPLVSRICWYVIKFIDAIQITRTLLAEVRTTGTVEVAQAAWLSRIEPLPEFLSELARRQLSVQLDFSPAKIKQLVQDMARPMEGYGAHQIGAGFVDEAICRDYLATFPGSRFLRFFGSAPLDPGTLGELDRSLPSLVPGAVVEEIVQTVRADSFVLDCPVR